MAWLEQAAGFLGGQEALADALGIASRQVRAKIAAERPVHDSDLRIAAAALTIRARQASDLANRLTSLITEQGNT